MSWAAARMPPSTLYLLADAHPAMIAPSTPTPITASTKNSPASRSTPTRPSPTGMTISTTRYGTRATAGAILKMVRSAAAGIRSSFWTNFTPSASSWAQPWKPPAYIGPRRDCMCAMTLCSVCPTSSGSTRNAATMTTSRMTTSRSIRAPILASILGPVGRHARRRHLAAARRAAARLAGLLRARPHLGHPRRQNEVLAQRMPLEPVRQQQRDQVGMPLEDHPEHLVRLALVPVGAPVDPDRARQNRVDTRHP